MVCEIYISVLMLTARSALDVTVSLHSWGSGSYLGPEIGNAECFT
jgi:hypothetical protein